MKIVIESDRERELCEMVLSMAKMTHKIPKFLRGDLDMKAISEFEQVFTEAYKESL